MRKKLWLASIFALLGAALLAPSLMGGRASQAERLSADDFAQGGYGKGFELSTFDPEDATLVSTLTGSEVWVGRDEMTASRPRLVFLNRRGARAGRGKVVLTGETGRFTLSSREGSVTGNVEIAQYDLAGRRPLLCLRTGAARFKIADKVIAADGPFTCDMAEATGDRSIHLAGNGFTISTEEHLIKIGKNVAARLEGNLMPFVDPDAGGEKKAAPAPTPAPTPIPPMLIACDGPATFDRGIEAEGIESTDKLLFSEHVVVTRQGEKILCERLEISFARAPKPSEAEAAAYVADKAIALGSVRAESPSQEAACNVLTYKRAENSFVLEGGGPDTPAVVIRSGEKIQGQVIRINSSTRQILTESSGAPGRVKVTYDIEKKRFLDGASPLPRENDRH